MLVSGPSLQIPVVGVVGVEVEVGVLVFVGLLQYRVFEGVALAQCSVTMVVVVHPLVDRRGLLADGLDRGMRVQEDEPRGQAA